MTLNYFQSRVSQGKINEEFYKPIIENDIKDKLNSNNQFNLFDFENLNFKIELKCREVERMKYKTTIIGYDKIEKGLQFMEEGKRVIFYFGFKHSGLYKFELKGDNYLNLKMSNIGCRFRENKKLHMEIPVELLEFVSNETPLQGAYSEKLKELKK
jgi:hypothetical protein